MKFIIVADTHFGYPDDCGFSMQTKYTAEAPEIFQALGEEAVAQNAEFIIHAGDLITDGTEEEIKRAVKHCHALPVPFYTVLGNHDTQPANFKELWLKYGGPIFPQGTLETTLVQGGLRIDLLNNAWGRASASWNQADETFTRLEPESFRRLRDGDQFLPRVIVIHSQIRPAYPRQTGEADIIHPPCNGFDAVGDAIIREFHPLLIAGGHNHINILEKLEDTYAVTVSSITEAPFEYKLVEFKDNRLTMQTCSLAPRIPFPFTCNPNAAFVQGFPQDRQFECRG